MARLILPDSLEAILKLVQDVRTKHTADGATSVITALLAENAIDIGLDEAAVENAIEKNVLFSTADKASEKHSKERELLFDPVWKNLTGGVQSLKKIYVANPNTLGDWGITVDGGTRIVYPTDFNERVSLVNTFWAHHATFGGSTSPLHAFITVNTIVPATELTASAAALAQHELFTENAINAETHSADRDDFLNPVIDHLLLIGQFLIGLFVANAKKAGDWGFTVDDSPREDVVRTGTVLPGGQKVLQHLAAGTQLNNTGTASWNAMRGTTPGGTTKTVLPGKSMTITFGFGTTTIINTSDAIEAGYEGTFNR